MNKHLSNKVLIDKLFRKLTKKRNFTCKIYSNNTVINTHFNINKKEKYIKISNIKKINKKIKIEFILDNLNFSFKSDFVMEKDFIQIKIPETLNVGFRRFLPRIKPTDMNISIDDILYEIKDITTEGLAFISNENLFNINELLRNVSIHLGEKHIIVDSKIMNISFQGSKIIYGIKFNTLEWNDFSILFSYILSCKYENLDYLSNYSNDKIFNLYENSGLLKHSGTYIDDFINITKNLSDPFLLNTNFCTHKNTELMSASASVRICSNTYLGQSLVSDPNARISVNYLKNAFMAMGEMFYHNPHFEYFLLYLDSNLSWNTNVYGSINNYINDDNLCLMERLNGYRIKLERNPVNNDYDYEIIEEMNPDKFIDYSNIHLKDLEINCYNYTKQDFFMTSTQLLYQSYKLFAKRKLFVVTENNKIISYVVADIYSDGINIFNVTDTCKIYLTTENVNFEKLVEVIYNEMFYFYKKFGKDYFILIIKDEYGEISIGYPKYDAFNSRFIGNKKGAKVFIDTLNFIM